MSKYYKTYGIFICQICGVEYLRDFDGTICCECSEMIRNNTVLEHAEYLKRCLLANIGLGKFRNAYEDAKKLYMLRINFKI
jgi:hypothetical protein